MRQPNVFWIVLLIPTVVRKLLEYNRVKLALSTWQGITTIESISVIAFFICVGFWLGFEFSKDDAKTFDRIQEDYRKELKEHYNKSREESVAVEKENAHFKTLIESLKSEIQQKERLIRFLDASLKEEKERNNRTPEEANKQALEAIS